MDILVTMVSIHLEAVEQAPCVFCYHASKIDVYDVGHLVVQVSGAADHIGEDLLLKTGDEKAEILDF